MFNRRLNEFVMVHDPTRSSRSQPFDEGPSTRSFGGTAVRPTSCCPTPSRTKHVQAVLKRSATQPRLLRRGGELSRLSRQQGVSGMVEVDAELHDHIRSRSLLWLPTVSFLKVAAVGTQGPRAKSVFLEEEPLFYRGRTCIHHRSSPHNKPFVHSASCCLYFIVRV